MNRNQKLVLFIYSAIVVLMIVYPPYHLRVQGFLIYSEYSWLWSPITSGGDQGRSAVGEINSVALTFQIICTSLAAIALTLAFKEPQRK